MVVNTQKTTAYRAPGSPPAAFAVESVIDELCTKLSMDPVEFRLRNAAKEGTREPAGPVFRRIGLVEVLQAAKDHPPPCRACWRAQPWQRGGSRSVVQRLGPGQRGGPNVKPRRHGGPGGRRAGYRGIAGSDGDAAG